MGVSGCGKSSVGQLLAEKLSISFIDADDHHPQSNIDKMSQGTPLTDNDRKPWLEQVNKIVIDHLESGAVVACSALKEKYRIQLSQSIESDSIWVYLKGDYDLIFNRMKSRADHFMDAGMLKSQFETLEAPRSAITIDITNSLESVVEEIKSNLDSLMSYPDIEQVSAFFSSLSTNWEIKLVTNTDTLECSLVKKNRTVRIKWFKNNPKEFWFSMHQEDRCDLVDWTEMFEPKESEALFKYLKQLTTRYLEHDTRTAKKWLFFGPGELQYLENDKWLDLRRPA